MNQYYIVYKKRPAAHGPLSTANTGGMARLLDETRTPYHNRTVIEHENLWWYRDRFYLIWMRYVPAMRNRQ